jgi:hypothetical protein
MCELTGNGPVRWWWSGGARMYYRLVRALDVDLLQYEPTGKTHK